MISVRNIRKAYSTRSGRVVALDGIGFDCAPGEFVCIVGPSGCGKSTLLNLIAGLDRPDQGEIRVNGSSAENHHDGRALIFQEAALFPWLSVAQNVEFGLKMRGIGRTERQEIARYHLRLVHLSRFADAYPHQLSGGMSQRVALARALALNPTVLLMDEPFGSLDAQTREILQGELQVIWAETKKTILFVTHNIRESVGLGDRILVMTARPGRIKCEVPVQLARPRQMRTVDLTRLADQVYDLLAEEIEKVKRDEFDPEWHLDRKRLPYLGDWDRGANI